MSKIIDAAYAAPKAIWNFTATDGLQTADALLRPFTDTFFTAAGTRYNYTTGQRGTKQETTRMPMLGQIITFDSLDGVKDGQQGMKVIRGSCSIIGKSINFLTKGTILVVWHQTGKRHSHPYLMKTGKFIDDFFTKVLGGPQKPRFEEKVPQDSKKELGKLSGRMTRCFECVKLLYTDVVNLEGKRVCRDVYLITANTSHALMYVLVVAELALEILPVASSKLASYGSFALTTGSVALTLPSWLAIAKCTTVIFFMVDDASKCAHRLYQGEQKTLSRVDLYLKIFDRVGKVVLVSTVIAGTVGMVSLASMPFLVISVSSLYLSLVGATHKRYTTQLTKRDLWLSKNKASTDGKRDVSPGLIAYTFSSTNAYSKNKAA